MGDHPPRIATAYSRRETNAPSDRRAKPVYQFPSTKVFHHTLNFWPETPISILNAIPTPLFAIPEDQPACTVAPSPPSLHCKSPKTSILKHPVTRTLNLSQNIKYLGNVKQ